MSEVPSPVPDPAVPVAASTQASAATGWGLMSRADFMTLTKARLSLMVVVTTFVGFWLGLGWAGFGWRMLHTIFGTTMTAFGAAIFNQLMEVEADAKMHRTADRPLPARRLRREYAFGLGWLFSAVGLLHLGTRVNVEAAYLGALTLITYIFIYTPMKKRSTLNTLVGAVSGALPPVIGWVGAVAGPDEATHRIFRWQPFVDQEAIFLFALLFLWQLPHFLAINWMYREEYIRGGFVMYANDDESGDTTSKLAVFYSIALALLAIHPWAAGFAGPVFTVVALALGGWLVMLALKFRAQRDRPSARKLFLSTLLYLPIVLVALCLLAKTRHTL
jgi:protoheme IX farnesyltransferase